MWRLSWCSGGNSANLPWLAAGGDPGLHTDAITLVAEVIEAKRKPSQPWGERRCTSFATQPPLPRPAETTIDEHRALLALGDQDVDPAGLSPPMGVTIRGASSAHLVVECGGAPPQVGDESATSL